MQKKMEGSQFLVLFIYFLMNTNFVMVECDFTYASDIDEITLALINISYVDASTGKVRNQREEIGKFSFGKIGSVTGLVVHLESMESCEHINQRLWPSETWIVLMPSGSCADTQKIRNVASTNASAAVIYDSKPASKFLRFGHKVVDIISVFISKEKGEEIRWLTKNGTRVFLHITIGTHNTFRYANINKTSVLFVVVSFAILMIISVAWLIFYYIQRFRYIHAKDLLARRLGAEAKVALSKIPTKTIRATDLHNAQQGDFADSCAVCIEMFKMGDFVRILPCKHVFHKGCVDPWLLEQRSCPMCKLDILKHYGLIGESLSRESVFNIEEPYVYQQPWRANTNRRGSDDIEIVHVPINHNHNCRQSSSSRCNLNQPNRSVVTVNNETQTTAISLSSPSSSAIVTEDMNAITAIPLSESQSLSFSCDELRAATGNDVKSSEPCTEHDYHHNHHSEANTAIGAARTTNSQVEATFSLERSDLNESRLSSPSKSSYKSCELYPLDDDCTRTQK